MVVPFRRCAAILVVMGLVVPGAQAQDAIRGKAVYEACVVCHKLEPKSNEQGPTLIRIIGRRSGALDDFRYSRAILRANIVWDEVTLDAYLADPQAYIIGMRMPFGGIADKAERADLIAFLKTLR
jgi:cytochrome c